MPVETLTRDYGVCLVVKGSFGSIIFAPHTAILFDAPLEPYLRYMDAVLLQASRTPAILGLDANAVSLMWLSKLFRHAEGQANYRQGELLSEWMLEALRGAVATKTILTTITIYIVEDVERRREFYIPPEPSNDETEIFGSGIASGINFSKYDKLVS